MYIVSIALGGCLKGSPVEFGITEDTGGHITYVLGSAQALSCHPKVDRVEIVTRLIDDPDLGPAYARPLEPLGKGLAIRRLDTGNRRYLSKEANAADRPAFIAALSRHIEASPRKPDLIHAHFADAGDVAIAMRERFGIPFVYTAHSLAIDKVRACDCEAAEARIIEEARVISAADAIVASSRDEAERQLMLYHGACPTRIHCIPPGASLSAAGGQNLDSARRLVEPFLRMPDKPMILAIARPVAKKNLAGLVDLYAGDPRLREQANLVIVAGLRNGPACGEPEQRDVINSLLAGLDRHDLYGSLALPKRHSQADIAALYALAARTRGVFVNPAFTEPYGLTLTEAAVNGLPVVATCHGGPNDIVARLRNGVVADPADPAGFADAIHKLLSDRAAWDLAARQGRDNAQYLNWAGYADRFMDVATSVIPDKTAIRPDVCYNRLLLCDIDNTLTGCRQGAQDFSRFLTNEPGLAFGVATGRSLQEAGRLLREWHQPDPCVLITSVGSEIYWSSNGRLRSDTAYAEHIDVGWDPDEVARRVATIAGIEPQAEVEQRRYKRSYFAPDLATVAAVRQAIDDLPVRIVHSHGRLLDVLPERAGKGAAMAWAARHMGISPRHVYAAGDSGNDLDMLSACRNPILVANHSKELAPLLGSPDIYLARRANAGGIVEAMQVFARRPAR